MLGEAETLYRRVESGKGHRYQPVGVDEACFRFPDGIHMVLVQGGSTWYTWNMRPGRADREAVLKLLETELADVLGEFCRNEAGGRHEMTESQKRGYAAYIEAAGPDAECWFTRPAACEVATKIRERLRERLEELDKE